MSRGAELEQFCQILLTLEAKFGDDLYTCLYFNVVVIKNFMRSQIAVTTGQVSSNFELIVCKNSYLTVTDNICFAQ